MSVTRTPHGTYMARWRDAAGRPRSKTLKRKREAEDYERRMLDERDRGHIRDPRAARITITDLADQWLAASRQLGDGGRDIYRRDLDRHILPALGDHRLDRLRDDHIDAYLTAKLGTHAPSTVHRHYRTIHAMLAFAVDRKKILTNPAGPVEPPRVEDTEMRFLDIDQVDRLAAEIPDRYRAWVLVMAWCGLRWSEARGLRRIDLLEDCTVIRVAGQLLATTRGWERREPKTRFGRRRVTVPAFVAQELADHLDEHAGPELVFPNAAGNPLISSSFTTQTFKKALGRAGIDPGVRIHDLRHTAVALAIRAGAHPKAIQTRMGHGSIRVTLDRYGHLYPDMDEALAADLDKLHSAAASTLTASEGTN